VLSVSICLSGDAERRDAPHVIVDRNLRVPQVDRALQAQPEVRRVAEQPGEPERHLGAHGATLAKKLVHVHGLTQDAKCGGEPASPLTLKS